MRAFLLLFLLAPAPWLAAEDSSGINAISGAASLAASVGGTTGVSVSIGLSLAFNEVGNVVAAYISQADKGVKTASGSIDVATFSNTMGENARHNDGANVAFIDGHAKWMMLDGQLLDTNWYYLRGAK